MKKKILSIFITIFALCTCMFTLTACGHEHSYTTSVTAPTCIEQGYTTYTCSCGDIYIGDYVDALGHDFADYTYNNDATCTGNGTETATCARDNCGKTDTRTKDDSALSHNYGTPSYTWNGDICTATIICSNDANHVETETVTAAYVKDTDATCLTSETGHYKAIFNNSAFEMQETEENSVANGESLKHSFNTPSYVWSGNQCTATRVCSRNSAHIEIETVTAVYIKDTDVTCDTPETGHYKATFENPAFIEQNTGKDGVENGCALNHDYDIPNYTWKDNQCTAKRVCKNDITHVESETVIGGYEKDSDATCNTPEKGHYVATFTNNAFTAQATATNSVEKGVKLGHKFIDYIYNNDATCTENGNETAICDRDNCSETDTREKLNTKLGHNYGTPTYSWNNDKCTATRVCSRDNTHIETETLTAVYQKDADATCNTSEKGHYVATFTNIAFTTQTTVANSVDKGEELGHSFSESTYIWNGNQCIATRVCLRDDSHTEIEVAKAVYIKDTEATCITAEKGHYIVNFINKSFEAQKTEDNSIINGEALNHDYGEVNYTWDNDECTAIRICKNDAAHIETETVTAKYVKDEDATCTTTEKGHYVVEFAKGAFDTQSTEINSVSIGGTKPHNYTELKYSASQHWYECICGDKVEIENHKGGIATCINKATCLSCGQLYGNFAPHTYSEEWQINSTHHWKDATCGCNVKGYYAEHSPDDSGWCTTCDLPVASTIGVLYDLSSDGTYVEVVGYNGSSTKVNILPTHNNLPVKTIYNEAFKNKSIIEVVIPDSVVSIGENAFKYCSNLRSVTIGNSVTSIGSYAFYRCSLLTSIKISSDVINIASHAFDGCDSSLYTTENNLRYVKANYNPCCILIEVINKNLSSYQINTQTKHIADYVFYNCERLTSITIPNSATSIGSSTFSGCSKLANIIIGKSVKNIGSLSFYGCGSLKSIEIPDGVTCIGSNAFQSCSSLTNILIPNSVTSIGVCSFNSCSSLTSITIGKGVKSIGSLALSDCAVLEKVNYTGTIDQWVQIEFDGLTANPLNYAKSLYINNELVTEVNITSAIKINSYALYNCSSLTSVVISDSVVSIGENAFRYCSNLRSVTIGNSVRSIGSSAFDTCGSLTSVTIPNSVTSIGENAFRYCISLTNIKYRGTEEQWNAISKGNSWNIGTVSYTITYNYTEE